MAKTQGKDVFISVNQGDDATPSWVTFAASTSDGFSGSTENMSGATKSDGGWVSNIPTDLSWEFSNSSLADKDTGDYDVAFELWSTKAVKQFKIATEDESYYRSGKGYISNLSESSERGDFLSFELTITGTDEVTNTPAV